MRARLAVIAATILAVTACTSTRTRPVVDLAGTEIPGAVASLERVTLGGVPQWILIRGASATKPLLLKIHGGPGQAEMAAVGFNRALEQDFLVVEWDQRGAGKSADAIDPRSDMTLDRIVEDTRELAERLLARYHQRQLILVGHSWGSVVGLTTVQRHPALFRAFVSTGQIVDFTRGTTIGHRALLDEARRRGDSTALRELTAIAPPPFVLDTTEARRDVYFRWLERFGAVWHGNASFDRVSWMLHAPEYGWNEKLRYTRAAERSWNLLRPQLAAANLARDIRHVDVPVVFALGRFDLMAPTALSAPYLETLVAPRKEVVWFERSAHFPQWEEPEEFAALLRRVHRSVP